MPILRRLRRVRRMVDMVVMLVGRSVEYLERWVRRRRVEGSLKWAAGASGVSRFWESKKDWN